MEQRNAIHTIKKVMPAVVSIVISKTAEAIQKEIPPELLPMIPFDKHHKMKVPPELKDGHGMVKIGGGSGFIVHENGIVITNKHVVADADASYAIIMDDNRHFPARILAWDPMDDIAILKVDAKGLPTVPLGDSRILELGAPVLAIGNALGLFKNTVSAGIISGLSRSIRASSGEDPRQPFQELRGLIQTDAAINPGNSGGPLVNMDGEAIGVNAAIVFGAQNLGFAIPIHVASRDLDDLKNHGRIRRPLLGLRYIMMNEGLKEAMKLPVAEGAVVLGHLPETQAVISGSPADKAGLKERDIIITCNEEKLTAEHDIQDILETREVGDVLHLTVLRGKRTLKTDVTLAERK